MRNLLPFVCARARTEVVINITLLVVTMAAFILFFTQNYLYSRGVLGQFIPGTGAERVVYNLIFAVFMFGSFAYQASRLSFFWNIRKRAAAAQESYQRFVSRGRTGAPHVEIIVPSYREEPHVIWQTLMSAALVDYPDRGIVLLLDNPPVPSDRADRELQQASRAQTNAVAELFAPIAARFAAAAESFRASGQGSADLQAATRTAAGLYVEAADFLRDIAARAARGDFGGADDHTRRFFLDRILREPARAHRERAHELRTTPQSLERLAAEFERLAYMFKVRLEVFERKKYANLSHMPTKAANLNSYISVMGRRFETVACSRGIELIERGIDEPTGEGEIVAPHDARYVVILDADSFLLADYATCMVSAMESPENSRAAVMQTPYTTIPGTPHVLERTAGATTDIYYYVTEGMGFAHAGSWVGASALIRKQALLEIAVNVEERGYTLPVYIQDTTVIEDTGATIDLARKNWSVENYPARLSHSATPSDFGALVVQRRRWANGGLIILPNLLGYLATRRLTLPNLLEALLRIHYLVMPACISISMLLMLIYPFDFKRVSSWIYVTLPPYLYLVCRDLAHTGYKRTDIFRAYALFLILLPVVLAGVKNSIRQLLFGVKAGFGRTPKIEHRTAIPLTCTAAILALFGWSVSISHADFVRGDGLHAAFALSNALALGYGIVTMIGLKAIGEDFANAVSSAAIQLWRAIVPARDPRPAQEPPALESPALVVSPSLQPLSVGASARRVAADRVRFSAIQSERAGPRENTSPAMGAPYVQPGSSLQPDASQPGASDESTHPWRTRFRQGHRD